MKEFLESKLDRYFKIQCSNEKTGNYTFKPIEAALEYNFLRFGNKYFIPAVSIDIDTGIFPQEAMDKLNLPTPTLIVKTTKGFHIHWFLKNPIKTSNSKQLRLLSETLKFLQESLGGDKFATTGSSGRIWRNPLKHPTTFSGKDYNFSEIFDLPFVKEQLPKRYSSKVKLNYSDILSKDFSNIVQGSRHSTLFDYARAFAYTTGCLDIFEEIEKKNQLLPSPLPKSEVKSIATSVKTFMNTKYNVEDTYKASERRIEFNRRVAKGQEKKKLHELATNLFKFFAPLQVLKNSTIREGSALLKTSKNTFTKHRDALLAYIKEIFSQKMVFVNPIDNFVVPLLRLHRIDLVCVRYNSS